MVVSGKQGLETSWQDVERGLWTVCQVPDRLRVGLWMVNNTDRLSLVGWTMLSRLDKLSREVSTKLSDLDRLSNLNRPSNLERLSSGLRTLSSFNRMSRGGCWEHSQNLKKLFIKFKDTEKKKYTVYIIEIRKLVNIIQKYEYIQLKYFRVEKDTEICIVSITAILIKW